MTIKHPEPIESNKCIPWEPLGQINAKDLPEPSDRYPGPWNDNWRGNGHVDVIDNQGRMFAHVYLWDGDDIKMFSRKLRIAFEWAVKTKVAMHKSQALPKVKATLSQYAELIDDTKRPFEEWLQLFKDALK